MKPSTRFLATTAMFTAITCILSIWQIPTPFGVPFTLQTFIIALCGYVLGEKAGCASVALYLLIGLIGVPVFTGMKAGPGVLLGPTGGYLIGFLFLCFFCGISLRVSRCLKKESLKHSTGILLGMIGLLGCHLPGVIHLNAVAEMHSLSRAAMAGSVPFLLKDILSVTAAYAASGVLRRALRGAGVAVRSNS